MAGVADRHGSDWGERAAVVIQVDDPGRVAFAARRHYRFVWRNCSRTASLGG